MCEQFNQNSLSEIPTTHRYSLTGKAEVTKDEQPGKEDTFTYMTLSH